MNKVYPVKFQVFIFVTPHSLIISQYQHFRGKCCLHIQGWNLSGEDAQELFSQGAMTVVSQNNARRSGDGS